MAKNDYAKRLTVSLRQQYQDGFNDGEALGVQLLTDVLMVTLGDRDDMEKITGGSAWGEKRIVRLVEKLRTNWTAVRAGVNGSEPEVVQAHVDENLRRIVGEQNFTPWEERYPMLGKVILKGD